jgi:hypothetical protein
MEQKPSIDEPAESLFYNLELNRDDPITTQTFDTLDELILSIEEELGIVGDNDFYAYSEEKDKAPNVSVQRIEAAEDVRVLSVFMAYNGEEIAMMARNDAGTEDNPSQPAASDIVFSKQSTVKNSNNALSNSEIEGVTTLISKRTFHKKRRVPFL